MDVTNLNCWYIRCRSLLRASKFAIWKCLSPNWTIPITTSSNGSATSDEAASTKRAVRKRIDSLTLYPSLSLSCPLIALRRTTKKKYRSLLVCVDPCRDRKAKKKNKQIKKKRNTQQHQHQQQQHFYVCRFLKSVKSFLFMKSSFPFRCCQKSSSHSNPPPPSLPLFLVWFHLYEVVVESPCSKKVRNVLLVYVWNSYVLPVSELPSFAHYIRDDCVRHQRYVIYVTCPLFE